MSTKAKLVVAATLTAAITAGLATPRSRRPRPPPRRAVAAR
ncbi:hypothetical protein ACFQ0M_43775 [Kitasatospora aburaviensis]